MARSAASLPLSLALAAAAAAQTPLLTVHGTKAAPLHQAIAAAADLDRDGCPDFAVATALANGGTGAVEVRSGRDGRTLLRVAGTTPGAFFGWSVGGGGDCDGDGFQDLVVGLVTDATSASRAGAVQVLSGKDGSRLWTALGDGAGDLLGTAVCIPGDVDRDGAADVLAGAPENGDPVPNYGTGYARLYSGRDGRVLRTFRGTAIADEFGSALAGVGDVDRDGWPDVAVTSLLEIRLGQGSARVYSGRDGRELHAWFSEPQGDHFGMSVIGAGDVDRDGVPDVAVGAINPYSFLQGAVWLFSGKDGRTIHRIRGGDRSGMFGMGLAALGDLDADGFADVAASDPLDSSSGAPLGRIQVHSGKDGSLLLGLDGDLAGAAFGAAIAALGDLDGDALTELVVASPGLATATQQGRARVLSLLDVATPGAGCGAGALPPRLDATAPRAGQPMTLSLASTLRSRGGALLLALLPDLPQDLGLGCTAYLDPALVVLLTTFRTDGAGRATLTLPVPSLRTLPGTSFAAQALVGPTAGPLGAELSNGLYATVR